MKYGFNAIADLLKRSMVLIQEMRLKAAERRGETSLIDWQEKDDGSLVTDVDTGNEMFLRENLTAGGEFFFGEESIASMMKDKRNAQVAQEYVDKALQGETWVVDPIDGTAPFAHRLPLWGISIGYMVGGVLRDGAIALPDLGQCFLTDGDAVKMATNIHAPLDEWRWQTLTQPVDVWNPGRMITLGQRFTRERTLPFKNPVMTPGSAVHSLSCLLTGNAIAYVGHVKLWDIAGVLPMLCRLGFRQQLLNGALMTENILRDNVFDLDMMSDECWALKDTFICARPNVLEYVRARL
ncbi:MAG: hypothetical protein IKP00_08125 [Victivallales bacterium]|nr:hypothetical protein [Victivallales bacterium]